jgi:prepilin-type N-terminal cleavage/methylation domain-containing protein
MRCTNHRLKVSQAGFTLIETVIVVAIIGIGAALAIPNFTQWYVQTQLRQTTAEVAGQLTLARMAGMNRNRSVDVTVMNAGGVVSLSAVPSSGGPVINSATFPAHVKSVVGSPVTVSFSSMGVRTSGGTGVQTIGLCDTYGRQYSVTIIASGKVNWSPNTSGSPCP